MRMAACLLVVLLGVGPVLAGPADDAEAAAALLGSATRALEEAESARDRVTALTATVGAFEEGLGAMRDGLRRVARREGQLTRKLHAQEHEISQLLGVLQNIETTAPPVLLLHPGGPLGSARSAMILADVTPGLNAQAENLRHDLEEVRTLRLLQRSAADLLEDGLAGVQQARAELSKAVADRTDLPKRFTEDPVRTAILISSTETLAGFASGLSQISEDEIQPVSADVSDLKGKLPLPVHGLLLHAAGEADAAGITRDGIVIATRPRALVVAPTAATIRYRGPLLDLGNVMILEPQDGTLFVFSGLAEVFGETGQVIPAGTPVGLMGGAEQEIGALLSLSSEGSGTDRSESLYIEVREGRDPVDPQTWFRTDKDG